MSMLYRYRKSGGFVQLLNLIETSGPQKQTKFLELVREEDPRWADAIVEKTLSIQKICGWSNEALMEVVANLQPLALSVMLHGLETEVREKILAAMSNSARRNVMDSFNASKPTPAEISTTFGRVITEVRKMIGDGRLRMDKIDPTLVIADDIEEQLKKPEKVKERDADSHDDAVFADSNVIEMHTAHPELGHVPSANPEVNMLKKKLQHLMTENANLKHEVLRLRSKLEQIKRIA